ncbi:hypothetical protein JX265_010247 [Neoarthrinium moseri]|uniref:ZN622/Rei1/Reh1 zinc finger C2H2-type domain-containing protein n=1 Tax=Neoarthrinium moseri TaxID=1658444 RepID=A0A9P9WEY4_9PEZI|nr:hypothetical protein JX265_010247 [Neoarthrinium moseri]
MGKLTGGHHDACSTPDFPAGNSFATELRDSDSQTESQNIPDEVHSLEGGFSAISLDEGSLQRTATIAFNALRCLFCRANSSTFQENLEHMLQKHGLFIPEAGLQVDFETIVEYLHLVIYGYFECIFCGSPRNNAQAAQQHMLGKGHCKIDLASDDSEYRDFYDYEESSEASGSEDDDGEHDTMRNRKTRHNANIVETGSFMRLSSGKILSHRSHNTTRFLHGSTSTRTPNGSTRISAGSLHVPEAASLPAASSTSDAGPSKSVAKWEATFQRQLSSLRAEDRRSMMHLTMPQQRALVMKSKKQVERARRDENDMLLKIQLKANR